MTSAICNCMAHNGFMTAKGLEEAAQRELELDALLAVEAPSPYLDKVGSVSAMVEVEDAYVWDDRVLDEQHRRFLDG